MATLHNTINSLASNFAHQLLAALRGASLEEIIAETSAGHVRRPGRRGPGQPRARLARSGGEVPTPFRGKRKGGRLARRSPEQIAQTLTKVVSLVKIHKKGLRAEEIRKALKLDVREVPRVLKEGLAKKALKSKGQKRATTYFAGAGGGHTAASKKAKHSATKRSAKRAAKKSPKKSMAKKTPRKPAKKAAKRTRAAKPKAATAKAPATAAVLATPSA